MVMPRIEMLPEGYQPTVEEFNKNEERFYILNWYNKEVAKVFVCPFTKELDVYVAGHCRESAISKDMRFVARIYMEG